MPTFNALSLSTRPLILALLMLMLSARARAETCTDPQRCLHTNDGKNQTAQAKLPLRAAPAAGSKITESKPSKLSQTTNTSNQNSSRCADATCQHAAHPLRMTSSNNNPRHTQQSITPRQPPSPMTCCPQQRGSRPALRYCSSGPILRGAISRSLGMR